MMYINLCSKLFIGGIHRSTTQDGLKHYFEKFGEVTICKLMIDKETGNSRGFGFVTYADPACINQVMASKPHTLDGKIVSIIHNFTLRMGRTFLIVYLLLYWIK